MKMLLLLLFTFTVNSLADSYGYAPQDYGDKRLSLDAAKNDPELFQAALIMAGNHASELAHDPEANPTQILQNSNYLYWLIHHLAQHPKYSLANSYDYFQRQQNNNRINITDSPDRHIRWIDWDMPGGTMKFFKNVVQYLPPNSKQLAVYDASEYGPTDDCCYTGDYTRAIKQVLINQTPVYIRESIFIFSNSDTASVFNAFTLTDNPQAPFKPYPLFTAPNGNRLSKLQFKDYCSRNREHSPIEYIDKNPPAIHIAKMPENDEANKLDFFISCNDTATSAVWTLQFNGETFTSVGTPPPVNNEH